MTMRAIPVRMTGVIIPERRVYPVILVMIKAGLGFNLSSLQVCAPTILNSLQFRLKT